MAQAKIACTLLNPPEEVSALKLKGWLHDQASLIEATSKPGDTCIIRLFLTKKVRYGFTQKKLDKVLQDIANKFPAIAGIELFIVEKPLNMAELEEERINANADLDDLALELESMSTNTEQPEQCFGYVTEAAEDEPLFDLPEEGLVCMVSSVTAQAVDDLFKQTGRTFAPGQWFVSEVTDGGRSHLVHGPFDGEGPALDFAKTHCKAIRFKSAPVLEML